MTDDADFQSVLHWLEERTGLRFREDQFADTVAIIRRIMSQLQVDHPASLASELDRRPAVMDSLVNELTVGEMYFFREPLAVIPSRRTLPAKRTSL